MSVKIEIGKSMTRDKLLSRLRDMQYERTNNDFGTGTYRVRGDSLDINLTVSEDRAVRVEFFGDDIDSIRIMNPISGEVIGKVDDVTIFPAKHNVTPEEKLKRAIVFIREDLEKEIKDFTDRGKLVEATRLKQRVNYDMEMIEETGFCKGIENYSRYIDGRSVGSSPSTLLDYFPDDYLTIIDESHITVPQIGGMYSGDRSRKENLVDYGFRMKSAMDNRHLTFEEFSQRTNQTVYTTATPSKFEIENSNKSAEEVLKSGI